MLFLVAQAMAQAHQAVSQVDILDHDLRIWDRQIVVGEIPIALDAEIDEPSADLFRTAARYAEDGDFRVMLLAELLKLVDMKDLDAVDLFAYFVGRIVESSDELVTVGVGGDEPAHR